MGRGFKSHQGPMEHVQVLRDTGWYLAPTAHHAHGMLQASPGGLHHVVFHLFPHTCFGEAGGVGVFCVGGSVPTERRVGESELTLRFEKLCGA